jgi:hypothetical protein
MMRVLAYQFALGVSAAEFHDETVDRDGFVYRIGRLGPEKPTFPFESFILLGSPAHLSDSVGPSRTFGALSRIAAAQNPNRSPILFP